MMQKEYKMKSNYEQMRNDYFWVLPWYRSNIFEILKPIRYNHDILYWYLY